MLNTRTENLPKQYSAASKRLNKHNQSIKLFYSAPKS